jgi:hypothetical protein
MKNEKVNEVKKSFADKALKIGLIMFAINFITSLGLIAITLSNPGAGIMLWMLAMFPMSIIGLAALVCVVIGFVNYIGKKC